MGRLNASSVVANGKISLRLIIRRRASKSRGYSTARVLEDAERIQIPCRGAGHLSVDVYLALRPSSLSRIILYIPPSRVTGRKELDGVGSIDAKTIATNVVAKRLREAADATVIRINFRSEMQEMTESDVPLLNGAAGLTDSVTARHTWPTPMHDVATAFDWIMHNAVPDGLKNDAKNPTGLGIYGALNGGSLALALAMTECHLDSSIRISAVATCNAIVDWVSIPDATSNNVLSQMKTAFFPPQATHPGSPFDPFASPIHFLRTPSKSVPLTAAQRASRDAEALGEAFRDVETLDDLIAQESWIEDGSSAVDINEPLISKGLTEDAIGGLIDKFTALQTLDNVSEIAAEVVEMEDMELDEWDERRAKEDYAEAMHEIVVEEASRQLKFTQETSPEPSRQGSDLKSKNRSDKDVTRKRRDVRINDATVMRHRKWPPSFPLLKIPYFRLAATELQGAGHDSTGMSVLASQTEEMAKLLRRAVSRDILAGVKHDTLGSESSARRADGGMGNRDTAGSKTEGQANQVETAKQLAEEKVQLIFEAAQADGDIDAINRVGDWFKRFL